MSDKDSHARRNTLDEMTIRRTEVPRGGASKGKGKGNPHPRSKAGIPGTRKVGKKRE